jgi:hypothetical protein
MLNYNYIAPSLRLKGRDVYGFSNPLLRVLAWVKINKRRRQFIFYHCDTLTAGKEKLLILP